ncbi:formylglycine-generating enzyme family protein [Glaciecola sp. XM2]|jgi:formylglycine-generating enzyme required for sulfatase activity|uniref:formylglycine-generating enzyme family protein n=1 Tax=Glaciecola sp. XM2 TaxID=1914931 RepID=UPI001BDED94A|nr:formylglycine-generating enzyme family protein [Glaciecola sp. XM2]MBT1450221.1 formylglycine-generating enzyme family protein [Glaciecola sp. XM2]
MNKTLAILSVAFILIISAVVYEIYSPNTKPTKQAHACSVESSMVIVQGGDMLMGAGGMYPEEFPVVERKVNSFYMSRTEVTNAEFKAFVEATGYVTMAEKAPDPSLYPDLPPDLLVAGSAVFVKLNEAVSAGTLMNWWHFVEGAYWRQPTGPNSSIIGKENYPVVHIAYQDAQAYAAWKGHRLPTEEEFEYAARNGLKNSQYARGDSLTTNNKHTANTWQGLFPFSDDGDDGHAGLAPVGCYDANRYGIHDLIGNVWEWTQSTYYPQHIQDNEQIPTHFPNQGYDPNQPGIAVGVIKGGSYLCADDFCMRYRPAARQAQDTGLGTTHIGFRTVKSVN